MDTKKISKLINDANARPIDDFLGLSPNKIFRLLHGSLEDLEDLCSFDVSFKQEHLCDVPVVREMRKLLQMVGDAKEAKATQNGFLPKKIVNAVYELALLDSGIEPFSVQSEEYCPHVHALRLSATDCGWLKLRNRKFSLTKEGQKVVDRNFAPEDYVKVLKHWMRKYNWSFPDGYEACHIVQASAIFSLFALSQKAREYLKYEDFLKIFLGAFPASLNDVEPDLPHSARSDRLSSILELRFIERFCIYFGLLDCEYDLPKATFRKKIHRIKITPLFQEVFSWLPAEKREIFLSEPLNRIIH